MEIKIDYTKSAHENAGDYYDRAKRLVQKRAGAEKAIKELERSLREAEKKALEKRQELRKVIDTNREWYESFHWFRTSEGLLAIGGRDARQNELMNSRHFSDNDLFFHADVFGASVFILKDGLGAGRDSREETAHFAACYSSAWASGTRSADVYAMRREQVSKSTGKGSLGTGSFLLKGEREWYRNVPLRLSFGLIKGKLNAIPSIESGRMEVTGWVNVAQGELKKSDAAKQIAKMLNYNDIDYIMRQLPPAGGFSVTLKKES